MPRGPTPPASWLAERRTPRAATLSESSEPRRHDPRRRATNARRRTDDRPPRPLTDTATRNIHVVAAASPRAPFGVTTSAFSLRSFSLVAAHGRLAERLATASERTRPAEKKHRSRSFSLIAAQSDSRTTRERTRPAKKGNTTKIVYSTPKISPATSATRATWRPSIAPGPARG